MTMSKNDDDKDNTTEHDDNPGDHCPLGDGGDMERIGNTDSYGCSECGMIDPH